VKLLCAVLILLAIWAGYVLDEKVNGLNESLITEKRQVNQLGLELRKMRDKYDARFTDEPFNPKLHRCLTWSGKNCSLYVTK